MNNLKKIINELEKDPDLIEARVLIEQFVQELKEVEKYLTSLRQLSEYGHGRLGMLRLVIGEDSNVV